MNLLQRQGFFNSIILYAGIVLGFFNLVILFQRFLSIEEIGFFNLLIAIAALYVQVASPGLSSIILRYFPYYRSEDGKHEGFVRFIAIFAALSFSLISMLFIFLKGPIIDFYQEKNGASLLRQYYYYIIPIAGSQIVFSILEGLARTRFKNILPTFLNEVALRVGTSIAVCLIFLKWIDYSDFILLFTISNGLIVLILWQNLRKEKYFQLGIISQRLHQHKSELIRFGFFAVLNGSSFVLIQSMDTLMLSFMTKQSMAFVGIYTTFFGIAMVINLPAKALNRTSYQIISEAWHNQDMTKIDKIYRKTSVVQCLVGCLLLIGMIINKNHLINLLHKPEYAHSFNVLIVLGLAFLVDITGGLNGHIINTSPYYKLVTFVMAAAVILIAGLNWLLIPSQGMMGAAIAYLITMILLNGTYFIFIYFKFGLQPFSRAYLRILVIAILCLSTGLYLPAQSNPYLDFVLRSGLTTVLFIGLTYLLKVSEDINESIRQVLSRIK